MPAQVVRWLSKHGQAVLHLEITIKDTDEPQQVWARGAVALFSLTPNLHTLEIKDQCDFLNPQHDLRCLRDLTCLQTLQLTSEDWTDLSHTSSIEPLRHLTALESLLLSVDLGSSLHFQLSHHLTDLARLTSLSLVCMCAVGDVPLSTNVASVFSQLVSLRGLELCGLTDTVPASFAKLSELRSLDLANFRKDAPPLTISASFMQCTHLLHVALSELSAATVGDWWGLCQSLVSLASLRKFSVSSSKLQSVAMGAWALQPRLVSLSITACSLIECPPGIISLTCLTQLDLRHNQLETIPPGPYLERLISLHLMDNSCFSANLMTPLAQAKSLQLLGLDRHSIEAEATLFALLPATCKRAPHAVI